MSLATGSVLNNRYRMVKQIAVGGFGAVYKAWDMNLGRPCAVKENLDATQAAQGQFEQEAKILSNLNHPNLARVTDYFAIPGKGQYLVMDYVEGEDLQEVLDSSGGPLPENQVLPWAIQVCVALGYLHSQNPPIIHRDIKPANIKITPGGKAVLVDFSIAKTYDPQLRTAQGARAVTSGYSPPEQYGSGKTDMRSDIFALGATLYTLLTTHILPDSIDVLTRVEPPPKTAAQVNPDIQPHISQAIETATQLEPDARYQRVHDFRSALQSEDKTDVDVSVPAQMFSHSKAVAPAVQLQKKQTPAGRFFRGNKVALLLLSAILAGILCATAVLAYIWNNGDAIFSPNQAAIPGPATVPAQNAPAPSTSMLFSDDFSNTSSGWDRVNDSEGITDYDSGAYRIFVNSVNTDVLANPGLDFSDVRLEVDAAKVAGSDNNDYGLVCRYQGIENFYFFIISSDGYYGIGKVVGGEQSLIGTDILLPSDVIKIGDASNHLRADCIGSKLSLYVNDEFLVQHEDTSLMSGDVGLMAGTIDAPGTDIHFDNFVVSRP